MKIVVASVVMMALENFYQLRMGNMEVIRM